MVLESNAGGIRVSNKNICTTMSTALNLPKLKHKTISQRRVYFIIEFGLYLYKDFDGNDKHIKLL